MMQEFNIHTCNLCWALLADSKEPCMTDYESLEHQIHPETKWAGHTQSSKTMINTISCKVYADCSLRQRLCHGDKKDPQEKADIVKSLKAALVPSTLALLDLAHNSKTGCLTNHDNS
jgi:hypothetical protein